MTEEQKLAISQSTTEHNQGNNYAEKFKTPQERKSLEDQYILHCERGLSDECFVPCDMQTFRRYLEVYALDFDTERIEEAQRKRQLFWEEQGNEGTFGRIMGFNASSWKFNMQNRFGWKDRSQVEVDDPRITDQSKLNELFAQTMENVNAKAKEEPTGDNGGAEEASDQETSKEESPSEEPAPEGGA